MAYSWEESPLPDGQAAVAATGDAGIPDNRWWWLLAAVFSIFIHAFLFFLFKFWEVSREAAPIKELVLDRPVRFHRVNIDPALLDGTDVAAPEPAAPQPVEADQAAAAVRMDEIDPLEFADLEAQDIVATPLVEQVENLAPPAPSIEEAGAGNLGDALAEMDARTEETLARELDSVREQLLRFKPVSDNQLILPLGEADSVADDPDDILAEMAGSQASSLAPAGGVPEGYASLDELLGYDGPAVDLSKPVMMPTDLLFAYNEATLRDTAKLSLMKLGFLIQKNPDAEFLIEGHTDTFGTEPYNQRLSERRAEAVKDWLVGTLRLEPDQLTTGGFGESRPLVDPSGSVDVQALNRRVEIVIRKRARAGSG
jgi:outer membrane protein OmpA-like peptidoglycan-associated protein